MLSLLCIAAVACGLLRWSGAMTVSVAVAPAAPGVAAPDSVVISQWRIRQWTGDG